MRLRSIAMSRATVRFGVTLACFCLASTNLTAQAMPAPNPAGTGTLDFGSTAMSTGTFGAAAEKARAVSASQGPAVARGSFTLPNGSPAARLSVTIVDLDGTGSTTATALPAVGSAVTNSVGQWTLTLPDPLPANLAALSKANGGVLNLSATAVGVSEGGTTFTATELVSVGAAKGSAATALSAAVRADAMPHTATLAAASRSFAGVKPAEPIPTKSNPTRISLPLDNPCTITSRVLSTGIVYTVVGEAHAYWDAKATFIYEDTLSTAFGVEASADGVHWGLSGSVTLGSSTSITTFTAPLGPYWGHQFQVPIRYNKVNYHDHCLHGVDSDQQQVRAAGYAVPPGGAVSRIGYDVSSADGYVRFNASNPAFRAYVDPNTGFGVAQNKSITYGFAASAFGVRITAQTTYTTTHAQRILAGGGSLSHDIWGATGPITNPGVFYSY